MPDFNPDEFLKAPSAGAFDPDAFLGSDSKPPDTVDPSKVREEELRKKYRERLLPQGGEEPGAAARFADALSYGITRPLAGLATGVQGLFSNDTPGSTFGERYRAGYGASQDYYKKAEENSSGWGGTAAEFAGDVLAPFPAGKIKAAGTAADAGRSLLARLVKQGATQGAITGATHNAEDVGSAAKGAAIGGALGGATSAVVGGASKLIPGVKGAEGEARKAAQGLTPDELKATAKPLFQALDMGGISYAQPQTKQLAKGIDDLIATNQYNKIAHSKISGYVDELAQKATQPQGMGFNELHNLRSALATEARGNDASTRTAAQKVIEKIDDLVLNNAPRGSLNPNNVDVAKTYSKARELWKAASVADDVGYLARKADRTIASKAGSNPDEINRGAFRPLMEKLDKPGAYQGAFTEDQRKQLARIVEGSTGQNFLRGTGAVINSPITKAVVGLGGGALGLHGGGLMGGILGGGAGRLGSEAGGLVTRGLNRAAANIGAGNIDALLRDITKSPVRNPSEMAQRILLAKEMAKRGAARMAGSKVNVQQP